MSPETVGWIITGFISLFMIFGLMWGAIRGLNRTAFRAGWIVLTVIIVLFLTPVLTNAIYNINFSSLGWTISGHKFSTIDKLIVDFAGTNKITADILAKNPAAYVLIKQLPFLLLNAFVFVILFWVCKIILWPIWAVITKFVIKKKDAEGNPKKKRRLLGMLVGVFLGLFIGSITIMPLVGVADTLNTLEQKSAARRVKGQGLVYDVVGKGGTGYMKAYENSLAGYIMQYTGLEFINSLMFGHLSSTEIYGKQINFKNEVLTVGMTYIDIEELIGLFDGKMTQTKLDRVLKLSRRIVNNVLDSKVIQVVADDLMPYMIEGMLDDDSFFVTLPSVGDKHSDEAIQDSLREFADKTTEVLKNDLNCLFDIMDLLNKDRLLITFMNPSDPESKISDSNYNVSSISSLFSDRLIDKVTNKLFEMKTSSTLVPIAMRTLFNMSADMLDIKNFENTGEATKQGLKSTFSGILKTTLALVNVIDIDNENYIVGEALPLVGKLLDFVKNYNGLNPEAYQQLIEGVENKLITFVDETLGGSSMNINDTLMNALKGCVSNLSLINSFETEFGQFADVVNNIKKFADDIAKDDNASIDLTVLGEALDSINGTVLFGSVDEHGVAYFNGIVCGMIEMAADAVGSSSETAGFKNVIMMICDNVDDFSENGHTYAEALPPLNDLINLVRDLPKQNNIANAFTDSDNTLFTDFGAALDKANTSPLLEGVVTEMAAELLTMARDQVRFDGAVGVAVDEIFDEIIFNIRNTPNISFEKEFGHIKSLINLISGNVEGDIDYANLAEEFNTIINDSDIITRSIIDKLLDVLIDQAIEEVKKKAGNIFINEYISVPDELINALKDYETFDDKVKALEIFSEGIEEKIAAGDPSIVDHFIKNLLLYQT